VDTEKRIVAVMLTITMVSMLSVNGILAPSQSYAQIVVSKSRSPINLAPPQGQQATSHPSVPSSSSTVSAISAHWARWVVQIPAPLNPILDSTGAHCAQNQVSNGNFWFLVGDFGGTAIRQCTIPNGKFIFFPVLNVIVTEQATISQDQSLAKQIADTITSAQASVDNVPLSSSNVIRAQSPPFGFVAPQDEILGDPPGPGTGVTDGFWVLLQPLSVGQHVIHFAGQTSDGFQLDVTYHISVQ